MPDFDVQVIGLSSPLAAAPVTTYTPAVSVRNNGLSAVTVTGVVRRYQAVAPGELLQTIQLTPKSIAAGATSDVLCSQTWTPTTGEIGTSYIFTADVVAKDDQVEENNHLSPTVITVVTGAPPPPPPVVTTHAAQHEHGGTDVLNVGGLAGELQDEQPAKDHAGKHEQGGADELSVDGLLGTLATPQPTAAHANEKHIIPFASVAALAAHDAAATAHASATNLEQTSRKDQPSGYAGLNAFGKISSTALPSPNGDAFTITTPGTKSTSGVSSKYAHDDHTHQSAGLLRSFYISGNINPGVEHSPLIHAHKIAEHEFALSGGFTTRDMLTFRWNPSAPTAMVARLRVGHTSLGVSGCLQQAGITSLLMAPGIYIVQVSCLATIQGLGGTSNLLGFLYLDIYQEGAPIGAARFTAIALGLPSFNLTQDFYCGVTIEHATGNLNQTHRAVELLAP